MTTKIQVANEVEVLRKARERLETWGWTQEDYQDDYGYCLVGALYNGSESNWDDDPAARLLAKAIYGNVPERVINSIIVWNDMPNRTRDEVMAVMDRAIGLALNSPILSEAA